MSTVSEETGAAITKDEQLFDQLMAVRESEGRLKGLREAWILMRMSRESRELAALLMSMEDRDGE